MEAPTITTAARSKGAKMGRALHPSLNNVRALAVPGLPRRYLQIDRGFQQRLAGGS